MGKVTVKDIHMDNPAHLDKAQARTFITKTMLG